MEEGKLPAIHFSHLLILLSSPNYSQLMGWCFPLSACLPEHGGLHLGDALKSGAGSSRTSPGFVINSRRAAANTTRPTSPASRTRPVLSWAFAGKGLLLVSLRPLSAWLFFQNLRHPHWPKQAQRQPRGGRPRGRVWWRLWEMGVRVRKQTQDTHRKTIRHFPARETKKTGEHLTLKQLTEVLQCAQLQSIHRQGARNISLGQQDCGTLFNS